MYSVFQKDHSKKHNYLKSPKGLWGQTQTRLYTENKREKVTWKMTVFGVRKGLSIGSPHPCPKAFRQRTVGEQEEQGMSCHK